MSYEWFLSVKKISNLESRTSNLEFYREIIHNKSFRKQ